MLTLLSNKLSVEGSLFLLPSEILSNIISEGNTKSFVSIYSSNKFLNNICKNLKYDDKLWEKLYRKLFTEQKLKKNIMKMHIVDIMKHKKKKLFLIIKRVNFYQEFIH
jgi:hypothetical protein